MNMKEVNVLQTSIPHLSQQMFLGTSTLAITAPELDQTISEHTQTSPIQPMQDSNMEEKQCKGRSRGTDHTWQSAQAWLGASLSMICRKVKTQ